MRERRALLTSVRRAILRLAFLADLVLAIRVPSCAARDALAGRSRQREKAMAASRRPPPDARL
jgi:hypothetical protein